jgi:hypothetical protein
MIFSCQPGWLAGEDCQNHADKDNKERRVNTGEGGVGIDQLGMIGKSA